MLGHAVGGSVFSCLRKLHAVSAVAAPVAFPTTLHKALFPPHFGSSCLFPGSRVSVTRAVTSPGSDVCICVSVSVCVYMCVYICV